MISGVVDGDKIFSAYNGSAYNYINFRIAASGALTGASATFSGAVTSAASLTT